MPGSVLQALGDPELFMDQTYRQSRNPELFLRLTYTRDKGQHFTWTDSKGSVRIEPASGPDLQAKTDYHKVAL